MKIYKSLSILAVTLSLASCAPKVIAPEKTVTLTPELSEGKVLYENNCAKCHKLYKPTEFDAAEWKKIMVSMQKKAKINDTQSASIYNYILAYL